MAEQGCLLSSCAEHRAEGSNPSLSAGAARIGRGRMSPIGLVVALPAAFAAVFVAVFVAAFAAAPAAASTIQPTGGVDGVVLDATGAVLPGARVGIEHPGRGLFRTQAAGATGRFGFSGLPPGVYRISASHPGFQDAAPEDVVVEAGAVVEVRFTLVLSGITEEVSAVARLLDRRGSGVRETVDRPVLEDLPNARDIWTVLEQTPGILMSKVNVGGAESGQQSLLSAAGSAWTQNQYHLNGVNLTDPSALGASIAYYAFDSFEEVEVSTAGHRAEIQTPGVFMNIVTRRGTNRFAGGAAAFYEHERFQAENLDDALRARGVGQANRMKQLYDGSVDLGGPIWRNRAWFYLNVSRYRVEPFLPGFFFADGEPGVDLTQLDNFLGRATVEVAEGHEIGLFAYRNEKYRPYRNASLFRPTPETTHYQDSVTSVSQVSWQGVFDESLLLEARLSRVDLHFPYGQQPDIEPDVSRWELNTGIWYGGSGTNTIYERDRWQAGFSATWFRDGLFGGTNEFKAGFEANRSPARTTWDLHGGIIYVHDRIEPIEVILYNDPVIAESATRNIGFYLQDTLVRGRLAIEAGARFDWWGAGYPAQENAPGAWGEVFESLGSRRTTAGDPGLVSWLGVAPRLGASFQLTEDGRTTARISAGRYLHQLGTSVPSYGNPNARASARFRFKDRNFNRLVDPGEVDFGSPLSVFLPVRNQVDPGLRQPLTDEFTLGIQREIPAGVTLGLTAILRSERNLIEDTDVGVPDEAWIPTPHTDPGRDFVTGTEDDVPITLWLQDPATLGQSEFLLFNPGLEASYRGLILEARRRYANGWQLLASVTASRSIGWLPGPGDQVDEGTGFPGPLLNNPNHGDLHEGPTFWDRPFIARLSGSARLPWGFQAAGSARAHSGWPNYRSVIFTSTPDGDPLPQGSTEVVVEPPGAARSPIVPLLDARLAWERTFSGGVRLTASFDVFNVLNLNQVIGEGSRDDSFGAIVGILPPRIARAGLRLRF